MWNALKSIKFADMYRVPLRTPNEYTLEFNYKTSKKKGKYFLKYEKGK